MSEAEVPYISCRDECGQRLPADAVEQAGWTFLPIRSRWRCPACRRVLEQINRPVPREGDAAEGPS